MITHVRENAQIVKQILSTNFFRPFRKCWRSVKRICMYILRSLKGQDMHDCSISNMSRTLFVSQLSSSVTCTRRTVHLMLKYMYMLSPHI